MCSVEEDVFYADMKGWHKKMNDVLQQLFSDVEEDLSDYEEDDDFFDIPEDDSAEDWAETWLDGIEADDVDGYREEWWEL